jgi:hypothetical protein
MTHTRHSWYTPSAWVSTILFEVASRAPNDMDMLIAAAYGVVEVCGIKRASKPAFAMLKTFLKSKLARKHDKA